MAFTTADFSKIWASTSPLTPYDFTESNYKEGWNFIGATPPARQMWDSVQKSNDEKMQYLFGVSPQYIGDAPNNTPTDFDLPAQGTYIIVTGHNSTAGVNSIWIVRTGGNTAFNMGGGSNITMTCAGTKITVTSNSGLANVWGILLAQ